MYVFYLSYASYLSFVFMNCLKLLKKSRQFVLDIKFLIFKIYSKNVPEYVTMEHSSY